jgi:hypothetical protein
LAAEVDPVALLPAKPAFLLGARLRSLLDSEMVRSAAAQSLPAGEQWRVLAESLGFDPLRDIDEVLIAATATGKSAPVLVVARGRFNLEKLGQNRPRYRNVPLLAPGKNAADAVIGLLDSTTALAGDLAEVRAAIDRRESGSVLGSALAARIATLRGRFDCWGFGEQPGGFSPAKVAPGAAPSGLDSIDRFQFGIQWTRGFDLAAELHFASLQDARELSTWLRTMEKMFRAQEPSLDQARFDVKMSGETLRLSLTVSEDQLKKAAARQTVRARAAAPAQPGVAAFEPRPQVSATEPRPGPQARPLVLSTPAAPPNPGDAPAVVRLPGAR